MKKRLLHIMLAAAAAALLLAGCETDPLPPSGGDPSSDTPAAEPAKEKVPGEAIAIEDNDNLLRAGTLTPLYGDESEEHGVLALFDGELSTTYIQSGCGSFEILWQPESPLALKGVSFGLGTGDEAIPGRFEVLASADGEEWTSIVSRKVEFPVRLGGWIETESESREKFGWFRFVVEAMPDMEAIELAEISLSTVVLTGPFSSFEEVYAAAGEYTWTDATPMGRHFETKPKVKTASSEQLAWLLDPSSEPDLLTAEGMAGSTYQARKVNLYPFGEPLPADVNQHNIGDCAALSVLASFAYLCPGFIRSIIEDRGDGTFTVSMYDPMGRPVKVGVRSTFLCNKKGELTCVSGKNDTATWATVLEKAILKYNKIYNGTSAIGGIASQTTAPLFTGNGRSCKFAPGTLTADKMRSILSICYDSGYMVVGGFKEKGYPIDWGTTVGAHTYAYMWSSDPDAVCAVRNPWGNGSGKKEDGVLRVFDHVDSNGNEPVISLLSMRIISLGSAVGYMKKEITPYVPPKW